jgi:hypothetical protein
VEGGGRRHRQSGGREAARGDLARVSGDFSTFIPHSSLGLRVELRKGTGAFCKCVKANLKAKSRGADSGLAP